MKVVGRTGLDPSSLQLAGIHQKEFRNCKQPNRLRLVFFSIILLLYVELAQEYSGCEFTVPNLKCPGVAVSRHGCSKAPKAALERLIFIT